MTRDASKSSAESAEAARSSQALRQRLMRACAGVEPAAVTDLLSRLGELPAFHDVRKPEIGLVMLRGRIGGDGAPFNLGEATVARAAVRLASGTVGFGWRLGRSLEAARSTAVADALIQDPEWQPRIVQALILPLEDTQRRKREARAEETAATRVEFFTLARGGD